jgi:hypothetical protein
VGLRATWPVRHLTSCDCLHRVLSGVCGSFASVGTLTCRIRRSVALSRRSGVARCPVRHRRTALNLLLPRLNRRLAVPWYAFVCSWWPTIACVWLCAVHVTCRRLADSGRPSRSPCPRRFVFLDVDTRRNSRHRSSDRKMADPQRTSQRGVFGYLRASYYCSRFAYIRAHSRSAKEQIPYFSRPVRLSYSGRLLRGPH